MADINSNPTSVPQPSHPESGGSTSGSPGPAAATAPEAAPVIGPGHEHGSENLPAHGNLQMNINNVTDQEPANNLDVNDMESESDLEDVDQDEVDGHLIEAEENFNQWHEGDSALGSDESVAPTSIDSSIRNHIWENGRRYHAYRAGTYLYPNDEIELNREDMKDHMTKLMLDGSLTFTKFDRDPRDALDLGTGTGKWAMDFADEHPGCRVLAVDLSPVQPNFAPPNLEFQVDDIETEWTYRPNSFDYIHIRYMATAVRNWPRLLEQCYQTLRPGGKIEIIDMDLDYTSDDGTVLPTNRLRLFFDELFSASATRGVSLTIVPEIPGQLNEKGFVGIRCECPKLPMGWWPKDPKLKEIGMWQYGQFTDALQGIAMGAFTKVLGRTVEEVEVMLLGIREHLRDQKIHGYWRNYFITAEKPS